MELQSQASFLLEQVTLTLQNATLALQRLQNTRSLQELVQTALDRLEADLLPLEEFSGLLREVLENATRDVPVAVVEASRALAAVLSISLEDLDLISRRRDVAILESRVSSVGDLLNKSNSFLDSLHRDFTVLNTSASESLTQSRELNIEAVQLLNRSRIALSVANQSAIDGNRIIVEANELLLELQRRFLGAQNLSSGLDEVLRNVEMAERLSLMAREEAERAAEQVQEIAGNINSAVDLLQGVSEMLTETLEVSG